MLFAVKHNMFCMAYSYAQAILYHLGVAQNRLIDSA